MKRFRLPLFLVLLGLLAACNPAQPPSERVNTLALADDLIITGVIDGPLSGGVPKAIELYAINDIPDLSIYSLGSANNGNGGGIPEVTLSGAASAGDYLFLASETSGFTSFFGFSPTFTSSAASINGDDAIELFTNGVVTDTFGDINTDGTGELWEYQDGWAYRISATGPDGAVFAIDNWFFSGPNALDGEVTNASAKTPFPLCNYAEGNCGASPPQPVTDIIINEIHADPDSSLGDANGDGTVDTSEDEFVEIFNNTGESLDLSGWFLEDSIGVRHTFPAGTVVADQCAIIVFGGGTPVGAFGGAKVQTASSGQLGLNNGGDTVTLSQDGVDRASVNYGSEGGDNQSLTRSPDISGDFVKHGTVSGTIFSPGTQLDGSAFAGCSVAPTVTFIHDVQGSGETSPMEGQTVIIEGIVVGDFQENDGDVFGTDLDGFHVQEEVSDYDNDVLSSEGIFIFARNAPDVALGDAVRVTGSVSEFRGLTEITASSVEILSSANPLPEPAQITLPIASLDELERFEGMLVQLPQDLVISEYFNFDRFGEIVLAEPSLADRLIQPTAVYEPGSAMATELADLIARSRITLDDGRTSQNPDPAYHPDGTAFTLNNLFRGGDTLRDVTGVLDYSFGLYRVQPIQGASYTAANPRPNAPEAVGGTLKVSSFNVLNYFLTLDQNGNDICSPQANQECRGADNPEEFARQRAKILSALAAIDADVFGLIELENTSGVEPLADLVAGLNAVFGSGTFAYVDTGTIGTDAIRVGLIYNTTTVKPVGDYAILDSTVDSRFVDTKNRPALAQTFLGLADGGVFTVAVNHLKSKGSDCNELSDPDLNDGQGNCNITRTQAAEALVDWLDTNPTGIADTDNLIIGDLNAYDKEDPIEAIVDGADGWLGTADDYTDLVKAYGGEYAYSYVFDGQVGYLDHALASQTLSAQVTGTTEWHINADEPDILDYDTSFKQDAQDALFEPNPYRSSDHDPVVIGLGLEGDANLIIDLLGAKINALAADGSLNQGQANALSRHLTNIERSLRRDNMNAARDQINGLKDQVENLRNDGTLSAAQSEDLLCLLDALTNALN